MSETLMISVSGMRGHVGTDLTPELVARHAAALGAWVRLAAAGLTAGARPAVVLGRDARTSGPMFARAAAAAWSRRRRCSSPWSITTPAPG
jgi:phosphomannomutase